jgi:hypothetical protein
MREDAIPAACDAVHLIHKKASQSVQDRHNKGASADRAMATHCMAFNSPDACVSMTFGSTACSVVGTVFRHPPDQSQG